jgi:hypothetical protein
VGLIDFMSCTPHQNLRNMAGAKRIPERDRAQLHCIVSLAEIAHRLNRRGLLNSHRQAVRTVASRSHLEASLIVSARISHSTAPFIVCRFYAHMRSNTPRGRGVAFAYRCVPYRGRWAFSLLQIRPTRIVDCRIFLIAIQLERRGSRRRLHSRHGTPI